MTPSWQSRVVCFAAKLVLKHRVWGSPTTAVRWVRRGLIVLWPWAKWLGLRVNVQSVQQGSVRGEWLDPRAIRSQGVLLYLHGGGFISGSAALFRLLSVRLCELLGARVFSLDYRLAPEYPFPAAIEDAVASYRWLLESGVSPHDIVVAGESAGGGLAFSLLLALRDNGTPLPAGILAMSPWTDMEGSGESVVKNAPTCVMCAENIPPLVALYLHGQPARAPLASPVYGDLTGLPPVLLQVSGSELLLDDARRMHQNAQAAGVRSRLSIYPGQPHGWHILYGILPEATAACREAAEFVQECWQRGRRDPPRVLPSN
jgi:acetyl esterase/lipase